MTETKSAMEENLTHSKKGRKYNKEERIKCKKLKQMMKKRIIVRNLSFKVNEEDLKKIFSKFGEVVEVKIPVNKDGRKRGFAFVQFKDFKSQMKAMKAMNFKEICGRPVAIDFALDKTTYQLQQNSQTSTPKFSQQSTPSEPDSDEEDKVHIKKEPVDIKEEKIDENDEDRKVANFLNEFNANDESEESFDETSDESSGSDSDENESHLSEDEDKSFKQSTNKRKHSEDVSEGKTVFIRNVSYKNTEEDLKEVMEEYGETVYCLLCMDPITDHPRGTAFVKFKERESADTLVKESEKEPGIILDGRRLSCTLALSREELSKKNFDSPEVKDKRNLRLLKCSVIMNGSKESEGVSHTDMAKRAQLEIVKKNKLKNVNFFVSDKRLAVHNLPKNITDKDLRTLFQKAAGKGARIKEARVMKDLKKTDSEGIPVSRGFGFVAFTEHEHSLKALTELNNNPKIFTASARPIVEFSVENKVALLSQERKREKLKLMQKKRMEAKLQSEQTEEKSSYMPKANVSSPLHLKRKKNKSYIKKKAPNLQDQKSKPKDIRNPSSPKKKRQKNVPKHKKQKTNVMNLQEKKLVSVLTDKYKQKLQDRLS